MWCPDMSPSVSVQQYPSTPAGLESLLSACRRIYPDQPNPLQVTAMVKYWLGGPDPLDYISMYSNPGDEKLDIPPHWHYISFGLSDLHGDGRVHEISGREMPSGFGFELSFRLQKEPGQTLPPTWPAALMQALAKYVFHSDNMLCAGDHVSWHCSLDNSESRLQHMLMTEDPQLQTVHTPLGNVNFVQIVGVCLEELQAAQNWNGPGVIELLKNVPGAGGPFLVTDMRRGETIFEIDPQLEDTVEQGIEVEGSNLSGVSARCCTWTNLDAAHRQTPDNSLAESDSEIHLPNISKQESDQIKVQLKKGLVHSKLGLPPISSTKSSIDLDDNETTHSKEGLMDAMVSSAERRLDATAEFFKTMLLQSVHITVNSEAGLLLPLALKGRLKHGRHFTYSSVYGNAITFVTPSVSGSFVNQEQPYAVHGPWLQIFLSEDTVEEMLRDIDILESPHELSLPKTFAWPDKKLAITVIP